jgi:hypothetical protein
MTKMGAPLLIGRIPPARRVSRPSPYLRAFRKTERVLDVNAELADCALDLRATSRNARLRPSRVPS